MNEQAFFLQPFSSINAPDLKIIGMIARQNNTLIINYILRGNLDEVIIPSTSQKSIRKHELWQETCFEFFLGVKNAPHYWEFNLSPDGHWNVYRFNNYRQEMQEEIRFLLLPFRVQTESNTLSLSLQLELDAIVSLDQSLEVAITTVIKHSNQEMTYWALTHRGLEADFHQRESFIIKFPN